MGLIEWWTVGYLLAAPFGLGIGVAYIIDGVLGILDLRRAERNGECLTCAASRNGCGTCTTHSSCGSTVPSRVAWRHADDAGSH